MCCRVDSFGVIMSQNNLPPDAKQGKSITWMISPKTTRRQPKSREPQLGLETLQGTEIVT